MTTSTIKQKTTVYLRNRLYSETGINCDGVIHQVSSKGLGQHVIGILIAYSEIPHGMKREEFTEIEI